MQLAESSEAPLRHEMTPAQVSPGLEHLAVAGTPRSGGTQVIEVPPDRRSRVSSNV